MSTKPQDRARHKGGFRLVRYFSVASLAAIGMVAALLAWHEQGQGEFFRNVQDEQGDFVREVQQDFAKKQEEAARRDLLTIHESGNVNLTRLFANALWDHDFAPFVAKAQAIGVDHCRAIPDVETGGKKAASPEKKACFSAAGKQIMALPGFAALNAKVVDSMKRSTVFKIKVFDLRGITVYSSEHAQMGEDKLTNEGWRRAVNGKPASELTHRDKFSAFEEVVENRDLISSYLPVYAPGTERIVGVFEVYSDVTPFLTQIKQTSADIRRTAAANEARIAKVAAQHQEQTESSSLTGLLVVFGMLIALFAALFLIVRHAERIMVAQEQSREHAQQQLAHSDKLASLGQMVAGVAHQMNTPLAFSHSNVSLVLQQLQAIEPPLRVASKFSEIVKKTAGDRVVINLAKARPTVEGCDSGPEDVRAMQEMLGDVLHGIEQMSELVVHMRDFTRLDRAHITDFNINDSLRTVIYIARSVIPNRVHVVEEYGALPSIPCVPAQLNQVFLNLITNAAQAIPESGTVTVRTRAEDGRVRVDVVDTGLGIPPDVLPHIFDTYFTTKPEGEGTGLGLSIARDIARNHGGDIEVSTQPGAGTTFSVWLPMGEEQALAKAA